VIDAVLDGGDCGLEPTTVVDLSSSLRDCREGKGSLEPIDRALAAACA